jgi:anti-sigma regulatory factor (Ser/Thr protein kinase)
MQQPKQCSVQVSHPLDLNDLQKESKAIALAIGFGKIASQEIVLAVSELATNLLKHARCGTITLTEIINGHKQGLQIESLDTGPGITNTGKSMATGGFSTARSPDYGLETVNRFTDQFEVRTHNGSGSHIICRRWLYQKESVVKSGSK